MKCPSEEDMAFGRICRHCGIKKSDINVAKIARESQSRLSKAMEKHLLCFDCRTDIIQSEKLKERNKAMNNAINELAFLPKIEYKYVEFDIQVLCNQYIPCFPSPFVYKSTVDVRITEIPSNKKLHNYEGSYCIANFGDISELYPGRVCTNNDEYSDSTLIIMKDDKNMTSGFIYANESEASDEVLLKNSNHQLTFYDCISGRSGSAGSFTFSSSSSHSLSNVTRHPTAVKVATETSCAVKTVYNNIHARGNYD